MIFAQDIVITAPSPPTPDDTLSDDVPDAVINAMFSDFRNLMCACGDNKNDQVDVLITAMIDRGINAGPRIVGWLVHLGFNRKHAGRRLSDGIGRRWFRDESRRYRNLV